MREELSTRLNANDTMEIIREKEEQIRGLLEEGEKLSKQQLQHSNIIKKLRVKEKESDNRITKQQKKIKDLEEELSQLQQVRLSYSTKLTFFCNDKNKEAISPLGHIVLSVLNYVHVIWPLLMLRC